MPPIDAANSPHDTSSDAAPAAYCGSGSTRETSLAETASAAAAPTSAGIAVSAAASSASEPAWARTPYPIRLEKAPVSAWERDRATR